jgi:hypothetical protein
MGALGIEPNYNDYESVIILTTILPWVNNSRNTGCVKCQL